ncbi:hypothetical protein BGZ97_008704 [Linnemannia gamsii]|uniref:Coth protein-domain-containing protein n=1 Tax=Linnemannia gamsii TaxID=64522 RepID=A0A9P6UQN0_9FUNG|nr:hypothetical protein BGZ97_008704 [Linnemannia gamsii]
MKIAAIPALLALSAVAQAALVKFSVIVPDAATVEVSIGGKATALTRPDANIPLYTGQAETGSETKYKYVAAGRAETFDRALPTGAATYNDFIDRPITYANIPELPWPIEKDPQWTRGAPKQAIFDTNYIPTIFVNGPAADLNSLITTPVSSKINCSITIVLANEVKTLNNVAFGIHGAGKKKNNAKQSWNFRLAEGETYQARSFFKLRHQEEDPTQIREKLYADIGRAMGSYTNEANMIRMYINNEGFGTFNLLDDITEYSYVDAMFYGGKPPAEYGALFDGASGASFAYSPTNEYWSWVVNKVKPIGSPLDVGPLCEAWSKTVKTDDAAVAEIDKMLDLDQHIRLMVLEYLTGNWDGYWEQQTNDGLYRDPTQGNKWYYLAQDFDATFGVNIPTPDLTFPEWSYTKYPAAFPGAVMINGLLENPTRKAAFETYLKKTVEVLFNNVTLTNRILKYHEFILPDLAWDRSIKQRSPGINFEWSFPMVTENLWRGVASPVGTGGGATIGLIEWIVKKSEAVAKEFSITISPTPVGPPTPSTNPPTPNPSPSGGNTGGNPSTPGTSGKPSGGNASNQGSAANHVLPQVFATLALVGGSALALMA